LRAFSRQLSNIFALQRLVVQTSWNAPIIRHANLHDEYIIEINKGTGVMNTMVRRYNKLCPDVAKTCVIVAALIMMIVLPRTSGRSNSSSTTQIHARVAECVVVLDWPAPVLEVGSELMPSEQVIAGPMVITVMANSPWAVYVHSDVSSGQPREFDLGLGEYVEGGCVLERPVEFSVALSGPWRALEGVPSIAVSKHKTGNNPESVELFFRLTSTFDDSPLPSGRVYGMNVTYTVLPVY